MDDIEVEVPCTYCGGILKLKKMVKLNTKTGEYEYACENCATMRKPG